MIWILIALPAEKGPVTVHFLLMFAWQASSVRSRCTGWVIRRRSLVAAQLEEVSVTSNDVIGASTGSVHAPGTPFTVQVSWVTTGGPSPGLVGKSPVLQLTIDRADNRPATLATARIGVMNGSWLGKSYGPRCNGGATG